MKAYTLEDQLFCWGAVVIAESRQEAANRWNEKEASWSPPVKPEDFEEHELEGFMFEAGGNG